MSSIGTNSQPLPHAGCGAATPPRTGQLPMPSGIDPRFAADLMGFGNAATMPVFGTAAAVPAYAMPVERFVSSQAGGVIVDKDGAPAGRIPAGSFVDTKNGTIFGPDGKAITLAEGTSADFFDLPDVAQLVADAKQAADASTFAQAHRPMLAAMSATTASGPTAKTAADHASMMQSFVDGQWGPGGVTPIKGGGGSAAGCDMDHATKTTATTASGGGSGSAVAGASGGGATTAGGGATTATGALPALTGNPMVDGINRVIADLMAQVRRLTPTPAAAAATGGGTATLAASTGAATLGSTDLLRLSVNDLVHAVGQLNLAIRETGILTGGGPGKDTAPPKTPAPPVEPPKTEVPATSSSPSTDSTTAPPAAGSSST